MADLFNFRGFLTSTNKKREAAAEQPPPAQPSNESTESAPAGTMTQGDFSYGADGMRRKSKEKK